ncbi:hypothetical protein C2E23DRAFT_890856 [Lenzites betulinus]|nr:hypothetical protein C2E23DRAFT_890856 [Lenzites betulinus]
MSALLSSTFWLLLNTPMVPPEPKPKTKAVPMVDLNKTRGTKRARRRPSTSSVESGVSTSTTEIDAQSAVAA